MADTIIQQSGSCKFFKCPKCKQGGFSKVFQALVRLPVLQVRCMIGIETGRMETVQTKDETVCFVCDSCGYVLRNGKTIIRTEEQLLDFLAH